MRVLITGITGILGRSVAKEAYDSGFEVIGIGRMKVRPKFNFPVELIRLNLATEDFDTKFLSDIDFVIHCAANTAMGSFRNDNQDQINVNATNRLLNASIASNVRKFIFVSTANTRVPGSKNKPGTEDRKTEITSSNINYINSKIKAEKLLFTAYAENGLETIVVMPTFIINPLAPGKSSNKLLEYCLKRRILFYPKGGKSFVDARDVSRVIINAIETGKAGESYLISGENYSFKEFFKTAIKLQGRRTIIMPLPNFILHFTGGIFTICERIFKKPLNLNIKTVKLLNENHYYDSCKAKKCLHFNSRSVINIIETRLKKSEV